MMASADDETRIAELKKYRDVIEKRTDHFCELCRLVCEVLDVQTTALTLLDETTSRIAAYHGYYSRDLPRDESLAINVVEQGKLVCVSDVNVLEDQRHSQAMLSCNIHSYLAVPLTTKSGVHIGSFYVSCDGTRQFSSKEIKLVEGFGRFANSLLIISQLKLQNAQMVSKLKPMVAKLKAQREKLQVNNRVFTQVSRLTGIAGWSLDVASNKLYWSDDVYKILELDVGTKIDLATAINFYHDDARATVANLVNKAIATAQPFEFEFPVVTAKGNKRLVRAMCETVSRHGRVVSLFGTFQDVTKQRAAERQSLQLQKMDAIGRLTGGLAHDFNNLLTVIKGNLQIFLRNSASSDPGREQVSAALAAAQHSTKLVNNLLSFSRSSDALPEVISPATVIQGLMDIMRGAADTNLKLVLPNDSIQWKISADPTQLETAILNLVLNARDASSGDSEITVKVEQVHNGMGETIFPPELTHGDVVKISVIDAGSGIPKAIHDKVIEPFFTTKDVNKGTGLGLSMVHGFVTSAGGVMSIESDEGVGTTVSLYFMRSPESTHDTITPQTTPKRILVVDDDLGVRALVTSMLAQLHYSSVGFGDPQEALQFLRADNEVAVLFADVRMPGGMNGLQLAQAAKAIRPDLRLILTSGFTGDRELMQAIQDERIAFLRKPYGENALGRMIQAVLNSGSAAA